MLQAKTSCAKKRDIGIQCERAPLCFQQFLNGSQQNFVHFTGVTKENFEVLYNVIGGDEICSLIKYNYDVSTPVKKFESLLPNRDRMFITLVRLRRGLPLRDLSYLFGISLKTASVIIYSWTRFMSERFRRYEPKMFVTKEHQDLTPNPLFEEFPNLRVILDSTDIEIQHPKHFGMQGNTWAPYKAENCIKYMIGIARSGAFIFVSQGIEGSASDNKIFMQSGILNKLKRNDAIMVDRGYDMEAELNARGIIVYSPSFLGKKRDHLTGREEISSKLLASRRIFVEMAMGKIWAFRLIRYQVPNKLIPVVDDLVFSAAFISNLAEEYVPNSHDNCDEDE